MPGRRPKNRQDQIQGRPKNQPTINPLASPDAGGTADQDAAARVSARGEYDGERVSNARDASRILLPFKKQVVAPQAQNFGASAEVSELDTNHTIESAGIDTSAASTTDPTVDDEGYTVVHGRARRSAAHGRPRPFVFIQASVDPTWRFDAVAPSVPIPAGVASLDAVAPPVTPSVPSANPVAILPPPRRSTGAFAFPSLIARPFDAVSPSVLSAPPPSADPPPVRPVRRVHFTDAPSVALPASVAGVTPCNAASPVVESVPPPSVPRTSSTNYKPIVSSATSSTNDPKSISKEGFSSVEGTPLAGSYPWCGTSPSTSPVDRPVKSGIKQNAASGTKARPANSTIFNGDTSSDPGLSTTKVKGSKKRQRENKKLKKLASEAKVNSPGANPDPIYDNPYVTYDDPNVLTTHRRRES